MSAPTPIRRKRIGLSLASPSLVSNRHIHYNILPCSNASRRWVSACCCLLASARAGKDELADLKVGLATVEQKLKNAVASESAESPLVSAVSTVVSELLPLMHK
jgi:hypothetical protein